LRREHPALAGGRLWELASDESGYIFLRSSEEERILVAFNNSGKAREFQVSVSDTAAEGSQGVKVLFGEAHAEIAGKQIQISAPAESLSIFALN
jgi:hypothetical protein